MGASAPDLPQDGHRPGSVPRTVQAPDAPAVRRAERLSRVRGLLLGLAIGDALTAPGNDRDRLTADGLLLGTATTQLACFTLEGLIRALVRADHQGDRPAPGMLWAAYQRWARLQSIAVPWPIKLSGWLHRVPALGAPRGDAPAVVAALRDARDGTPPAAARNGRVSRGHHALTARLPIATVPAPAAWTAEVVAATHSDPEDIQMAVAGVEVARAALTAPTVRQAAAHVPGPVAAAAAEGSVRAAPGGRPRPRPVPSPGGDSALAALRDGVAVAERCTGPDDIADTLHSARDLPVPGAAGPLAGALLGAVHGAERLPVGLVARLELGWVIDTLARDLVAQIEDRPAGGALQYGADPHWWSRYPGS